MELHGWQGYIFSRNFNGTFVPQRVQTLVIREYCKKNKKHFLLSSTEYNMENCFMMLKAMVEEHLNIEAIVFYSTYLLPSDYKMRKDAYKKLLESGRELHFALEEIVVRNQEEIEKLEDLLMVRELTQADVSF